VCHVDCVTTSYWFCQLQLGHPPLSGAVLGTPSPRSCIVPAVPPSAVGGHRFFLEVSLTHIVSNKRLVTLRCNEVQALRDPITHVPFLHLVGDMSEDPTPAAVACHLPHLMLSSSAGIHVHDQGNRFTVGRGRLVCTLRNLDTGAAWEWAVPYDLATMGKMVDEEYAPFPASGAATTGPESRRLSPLQLVYDDPLSGHRVALRVTVARVPTVESLAQERPGGVGSAGFHAASQVAAQAAGPVPEQRERSLSSASSSDSLSSLHSSASGGASGGDGTVTYAVSMVRVEMRGATHGDSGVPYGGVVSPERLGAGGMGGRGAGRGVVVGGSAVGVGGVGGGPGGVGVGGGMGRGGGGYGRGGYGRGALTAPVFAVGMVDPAMDPAMGRGGWNGYMGDGMGGRRHGGSVSSMSSVSGDDSDTDLSEWGHSEGFESDASRGYSSGPHGHHGDGHTPSNRRGPGSMGSRGHGSSGVAAWGGGSFNTPLYSITGRVADVAKTQAGSKYLQVW
jgi:hypothetical protein